MATESPAEVHGRFNVMDGALDAGGAGHGRVKKGESKNEAW